MDRPNVGRATIIRGNALELALADNSVDLVVTSPPYFGLRSYQDGGEHYEGQIGDEPTPAEFVDALIAATAEMVRVLKPSGSIWVNLGDKYAGHTNGTGGHRALKRTPGSAGTTAVGAPTKSLIGIPWRYAIRCIDDLGLILRAEVIWSKPNGLPESVTDRVRRSHETWFHFTKEPRYFSAVDEIREAYDAPSATRSNPGRNHNRKDGGGNPRSAAESMNPLGKLPGSVWAVPTQPLKVPDHLGVDHFAAFPMEWPRRIILGWSPSGVCVECGEGRRPLTSAPEKIGGRIRGEVDAMALGVDEAGGHGFTAIGARSQYSTTRSVIGYVCACGPWETSPHSGICVDCGSDSDWADACSACGRTTAPTTPAIVLDPFGGTGTTALVAKALGRHGISNDMSADYCRLAEWRTNDPTELARAMQVDKPAEQVKGQADLFDLIEGVGA